MDLIGIQGDKAENTVFISVLGRGDCCYGLVAYEGFDGLNDFLMMAMSGRMNLSVESANIKLKRVQRLAGLEKFKAGMAGFM